MSDSMRMMISIALVPIIWALLQYFVFSPLNKLAHKYLPKKIADALTKRRFEK